MEEFLIYQNAFKDGLNYVLYSDEEERNQPELDLTNIESVGYYDGFEYGEYCERIGTTMSISQENLIATIDKYHTQALKRMSEYRENNKVVK